MSTKTKDKERLSRSSSKRSKRDTEVENDLIVLVVDGKTVRVDRSLVCKHSSVLKEKIQDVQEEMVKREKDMNREPFGIDLCAEWLQGSEKFGDLRVELVGQKYKDVKATMTYLDMLDNKIELTEKAALQILPVVEKYKIRRLRHRCDDVILMAIKSSGNSDKFELLEYLGIADRYQLKCVRKYCMEEMSNKFDSVSRKQVSEDKHINEKTKVELLNAMFDKLQISYEYEVQQVRADMDERCREIEKNRDEYMEQTEQWKIELNEQVDAVAKANNEDHKKLTEDSYQKDLFKKLNEDVAYFNGEIEKELALLREKMEGVVLRMNDFEGKEEEERQQMLVMLEIAIESAQQKKEDNADMINNIIVRVGELERNAGHVTQEKQNIMGSIDDAWKQTAENTDIAKLVTINQFDQKLKVCTINETLQAKLRVNHELQAKLEQLTTILDEKTQLLTELDVKVIDFELRFEKTEVELRKYAKRDSELNTWIKWSKPENTDGKCTCFRHTDARRILCS